MTVTNSTVSGNTAGHGGGVFSYEGSTDLINSTVQGNRANTSGGGLENCYRGSVTLTRTLISGNSAPRASEVNTIIDDSRGDLTAANFNLFGHGGLTNAQALVGFTPGTTDITATSNCHRPTALGAILKTALAKNGGLTSTHALVAGSPAVDAVNDGTCPPPARDQRGVKRRAMATAMAGLLTTSAHLRVDTRRRRAIDCPSPSWDVRSSPTAS